MSRHNGRGAPFPGFSRGVPLVGERPQPPKGRFYYYVPVLVRREGLPLDADEVQIWFAQQLNGINFQAIAPQAVQYLKAKSPDLPEPSVVVLAPTFLAFVPQEEIDRQEREANSKIEVVQ